MRIHLSYTATQGTGGVIDITADGKPAGRIERLYGAAVQARGAAHDQRQRYGFSASRKDDTYDFSAARVDVKAIADKLGKYPTFDACGVFEALRRFAVGGAYHGPNKRRTRQLANDQAARVSALVQLEF